jgi:hypothetical protein
MYNQYKTGIMRARHYTNEKFDSFDWAKLGENTDINATDENWAKTAHVGVWFNVGGEKKLAEAYDEYMEAEIVIENPIDWLGSLEELAEELANYESGEAYREEMKGRGYDGIVLADEEFGGISYVVFDNSQITIIK